MPYISPDEAPVFDAPGLVVTGLAAPSRGAKETSVWRLRLLPGAPAVPHTMDREETFVAIAGRAVAEIDGRQFEVAAGGALIVPPETVFSLANPGDEPFEAVVALPAAGRARIGDDEPFSPPWAT